MLDKVQLIKQEIERLKNEQLSIFSKGENDEICGTALICIGVYNQLLSFINSLSEEPTSEDTCLLGHDYKNRDCENCSFELCKRFSKPANEDLEEEIKHYINEEVFVTSENVVISKHHEFHNFYVENLVDVARHFAEWGRNHFDDKSKMISEDLGEASEEYAFTNWESDDYHEGASEFLPFDPIGHTKKCFIAGAEWQEKKMMKDAVEGIIDIRKWPAKAQVEFYNRLPVFDVRTGDKVKIIIIKTE